MKIDMSESAAWAIIVPFCAIAVAIIFSSLAFAPASVSIPPLSIPTDMDPELAKEVVQAWTEAVKAIMETQQ